MHSGFTLKHVYDMFELAGCVGLYHPVRNIPDHNMIQWNMDLTQYKQSEPTTEELSENTESATYVKYDVSDIPETLLQDNSTPQILHEAIDRIECQVMTQEQLNSMFRDFCDIVKNDIDDKLSHKEININKMLSDKCRKVNKHYWNE